MDTKEIIMSHKRPAAQASHTAKQIRSAIAGSFENNADLADVDTTATTGQRFSPGINDS